MGIALKSIYAQHGVLGLYRGISSALPRVVVASAVQLSTFETSLGKPKQGFIEIDQNLDFPVITFPNLAEFVRSSNLAMSQNRWTSAFLASLVSGILVAIAMAPFDLMSIRFYNQGVDAQGRGQLYNSVFDCGRKIYQKEGLRGFYKGWTANYFRLGPHTLLSLVFWDQLKHYHHMYELGEGTTAAIGD